MFTVGQKVVCVDAFPQGRTGFNSCMNGLTEGRVYTVRGVAVVDPPGLELGAELCIWTEEIYRKHYPFWGGETPYLASRFRPVVEKKTDISQFQEIARHPNPSALGFVDDQPEGVV